MNEVNKIPVNRCFGANCQSDQQREDKVKQILSDAVQRRRANQVIDNLLGQFKGKSILQLLPVIKRRCARSVLDVAIERVERRKNALKITDQIFLAQFKANLDNPE